MGFEQPQRRDLTGDAEWLASLLARLLPDEPEVLGGGGVFERRRDSGDVHVFARGFRQPLDEGARLEWLPMEALCYSGCRAENRLTLSLEPGAQALGWDVTALGLPVAPPVPDPDGRTVSVIAG